MIYAGLVGHALTAIALAATLPSPQRGYPDIVLRIPTDQYFQRGDRIPVEYHTTADAYVTVFRVDTDGRVRVLRPREPWNQTSVKGGAWHAVAGGPGESYAFAVDDYPGIGYVFAIASERPFRYGAYVLNDHWDYRAVAHAGRISGDPYVAFGDLIDHIVAPDDTTYAFDVVPYRVGGRYDYPRFLCYDCHSYAPYSAWNPYRERCGTFRIVILDPPSDCIARHYPAGARVQYHRARLDPRYIIETRGATDPFVEHVTEPRTAGAAPAQPRGVTGRDVGGVGTIRTPVDRGLGSAIRRLLTPDARRPADSTRIPAGPGVRTPARPQLERRVPAARDTTPPNKARRPPSSSEGTSESPATRPPGTDPRRPSTPVTKPPPGRTDARRPPPAST